MFQALGNFVSRRWPFVLAAWALLAIVAYWVAPPWNETVLDRQFAFLPDSMSSRRGEDLFKRTFPKQVNPCSVGIVFERLDGVLTKQDKQFIKRDVDPDLKHIAAEHKIVDTVSTLDDPDIGPLLVSSDKKATLAVLNLTTELLEHRNWGVIDDINALMRKLYAEKKVPVGLNITLTGSGAVGCDTTHAEVVSVDRIQFWTVSLVIILLLAIYRAPLLAIVPLLTVFLVVEIALRFLSMLAEANIIGLFQGIQVFLTIIIYGAGVDYCLFFIARYREELDRYRAEGPDGERKRYRQSIAVALGKVGGALTASALTVTLAIGMMAFAKFGQFHEAGIAISATLFLALCAVLTLVPALLRCAGHCAFWPKKDWHGGLSEVSACSGGAWGMMPWEKVADVIRRRPGLTWLASVAFMVPFAIIAFFNLTNVEIDMLSRLRVDAPSIVGTKALERHFPAGITGPVVVLIDAKNVDFRTDAGNDLIDTLTNRLVEQKDQLGVADIRSLTRPLGITPQAQEALNAIAIRQQLDEQENNKKLVKDEHTAAQQFYVSGGNVTQLQIVLTEDPLSRMAVDQLNLLQKTIQADLPPELANAEVLYVGQTSSIRDLSTVTWQDQWRIQVLVVVMVFAILVILLRRPVVSLYLILSVLLSFYATLGATDLLFWALNPSAYTGLDWKVPIFLFTILVAVGEDYNIFLMTRIHEEQEVYGPEEGVTHALCKTGRIITSCGIIMAGTFATLLAGALSDLRQLGFALAVGVLLDTFVVRPILVPTFIILLHRFVGRVQGKMPAQGQLRPSLKRFFARVK